MSRIAFAGRNPFYRDLLAYARGKTGLELAGVFCNPEEDPGIQKWLTEVGIESYPLDRLKDSSTVVSLLDGMSPAWLINFNSVTVYGPEILEIPSMGCLNMHPGLLPEYAGLHTHQWAIRNGETEFGSTLHWMVPVVDAGDIVLQEKFDLSGDETGLDLFIRCLEAGHRLVKEALDLIAVGESLPRLPQDLSRRTIYLDRDARDGTVDWEDDASHILRFFRAADYGPLDSPTYTPQTCYRGERVLLREAEPGRLTAASPGEIVSIRSTRLEVACRDGHSISVKIEDCEDIDLQIGAVFS